MNSHQVPFYLEGLVSANDFVDVTVGTFMYRYFKEDNKDVAIKDVPSKSITTIVSIGLFEDSSIYVICINKIIYNRERNKARDENFKILVHKILKHMNEYYDPHAILIANGTSVDIYEGCIGSGEITDYLND